MTRNRLANADVAPFRSKLATHRQSAEMVVTLYHNVVEPEGFAYTDRWYICSVL